MFHPSHLRGGRLHRFLGHVAYPVRPDSGLTTAELPFRFTQNVRTDMCIRGKTPYVTSEHYMVFCISHDRLLLKFTQTIKAAQR